MVLARVLKSAKNPEPSAQSLQPSPGQGEDVDVSGGSGVETFGGKKVPEEKLSLNSKQVLVGDYPKILDLRKYTFEPKIFLHLSDEFNKAAKEGRPPQPNICIANNNCVETVYFPCDEIGYDYAVFSNLPNLKELYICRKDEHSIWSGELKWLICKNLPNLRKIAIEGDVRWLELEDIPSLEIVDVSKCNSLDYFSIKNAHALKRVNVKSCKKLREISDLSEEFKNKLGITKQIQKTQEKSKRDGKIYKNMTFTDIDYLLENINLGAKLATRRGLFPMDEFDRTNTGFCYGRESDPDFRSFSFDLLQPLAHVYTGGTGVIYVYDFLCHDYSRHGYGICSSEGYSSQENCLDSALHCMIDRGLDLPSIDELRKKCRRASSINGFQKIYKKLSVQVLDFLNQLIAEENSRSPLSR